MIFLTLWIVLGPNRGLRYSIFPNNLFSETPLFQGFLLRAFDKPAVAPDRYCPWPDKRGLVSGGGLFCHRRRNDKKTIGILWGGSPFWLDRSSNLDKS